MRSGFSRIRYPLLFLGILVLVMAMWAGLVRMGWFMPGLTSTAVANHGPLMVSGFLGTVIGLERGVGIGKDWGFAGPFFAAAGGLALILGLPTHLGAFLLTLSSVGLTVVFAYILYHERELHTASLTVGVLFWLAGNLLWLSGAAISQVVIWWAGYLILTISGERLELSRLVRIPHAAKIVFLFIIAAMIAGLSVSIVSQNWGWRLFGVSLLAFASWLLTYDIAKRTVKMGGLTQFIAVCMLSGYFWLGVAGVVAIGWGFPSGFRYDAVLHSVFLGFVMSMIFGHAPVIFPAVLARPMDYSKAFFAHWGLLHFSVLLRVGSDFFAFQAGRQIGGVLNVVAVLVFLGNTVLAIRRGILLAAKKNQAATK